MHPSDIVAVAVLGLFAVLGATRWLRVLCGMLLGLVAGAVLLGLAGLTLQGAGGNPAEFVAAGKVMPYLTDRVGHALEDVQNHLEDSGKKGLPPESDTDTEQTSEAVGRGPLRGSNVRPGRG